MAQERSYWILEVIHIQKPTSMKHEIRSALSAILINTYSKVHISLGGTCHKNI